MIESFSRKTWEWVVFQVKEAKNGIKSDPNGGWFECLEQGRAVLKGTSWRSTGLSLASRWDFLKDNEVIYTGHRMLKVTSEWIGLNVICKLCYLLCLNWWTWQIARFFCSNLLEQHEVFIEKRNVQYQGLERSEWKISVIHCLCFFSCCLCQSSIFFRLEL